MKRNTTPISDAISQISFIGNITPAIWYQKIKGKAKKTKHGTISQTADFLAIGTSYKKAINLLLIFLV